MEYKEYLFREEFEVPPFKEANYLPNKINEIFKKSLEDRNLHLESVKILNEKTFEIEGCYKKVLVVVKYLARERNQDDDIREQIEFMIKGLA